MALALYSHLIHRIFIWFYYSFLISIRCSNTNRILTNNIQKEIFLMVLLIWKKLIGTGVSMRRYPTSKGKEKPQQDSLSNSMKLWVMPCRATQDRWVMVESSEKKWSTGEGNGKPLQYPCLENPMNSIKRQKDRILKDELPRSVGAQYATGDQ